MTVLLNQADVPAARTVPKGLALDTAALLCILLFALVVIGAAAESATDPVHRLNATQVVRAISFLLTRSVLSRDGLRYIRGAVWEMARHI